MFPDAEVFIEQRLKNQMLKKRRLSQIEIDYMLDQFKMAMSKNGMVTYDIENAFRRAEWQ